MLTLIISIIAAIVSVYVFVTNSPEKRNRWQLKIPVHLFVGAGLMWMVDIAVLIADEGFDVIFEQTAEEIIDDALLGLVITGSGIFVWFSGYLLHSRHKPEAV